jgi:eukaryotic-like serine/threonine-protein kinase
MLTELHPTEQQLTEFMLGKLPDSDHAELEAHLSACDSCQNRAAEIRPADTFVGLLTFARTRIDAGRAVATTPSPQNLSTPTIIWPAPELETGSFRPQIPDFMANHPRYRLLRQIAGGGMGNVWLAKHLVMKRDVAVKVIRTDKRNRPGAIERFLKEIQAVAMLKHDNIVTAYDAEVIGEHCLLVMEHVPGHTLSELVKDGPLSVPDACRAARDAARGLAFAHAAGLVHRDVKPGNLIRNAAGITQVLDFGLVMANADKQGDTPGEKQVIGTPAYIAPEQIEEADAADARADVYSLGCTLYHLLSGRMPFPTSTA